MNPAPLLTLPIEGYAFNDFIFSPQKEMLDEDNKNKSQYSTSPLNSMAESCGNQVGIAIQSTEKKIWSQMNQERILSDWNAFVRKVSQITPSQKQMCLMLLRKKVCYLESVIAQEYETFKSTKLNEDQL